MADSATASQQPQQPALLSTSVLSLPYSQLLTDGLARQEAIGALQAVAQLAGQSGEYRQRLINDGCSLSLLASLVTQAAEPAASRSDTAVSKDAGDDPSLPLLTSCIRACGNVCIDNEAAREVLLSHGALSAIVACLRRHRQSDVLSLCIGALANLVCQHAAGQQAFFALDPTLHITAALNRTILRLRDGSGDGDDMLLCRLALRLYINLLASTSSTPLSVCLQQQRVVLSSALLQSCLSLARCFVIPITDQPDRDDGGLLLDLCSLLSALHPSLLAEDTALHGRLGSLVIDMAKRNDPQLQAVALPLLASWSQTLPQLVLPFLISRLQSSFPHLQLTALRCLASLTAEEGAEGEEELVLRVLAVIKRLAVLCRTGVLAVREEAMRLVRHVARRQESRQEVWEAAGMADSLLQALREEGDDSERLRLEATGLVRALSLSPALHGRMDRAAIVHRLLEAMAREGGRPASEQRELLINGLHRALRNLVSVTAERDGDDVDAPNSLWQWKQLTAPPPAASVLSAHKSIAARLLTAAAVLPASWPPPSALARQETARLVAAVVAAAGAQAAAQCAPLLANPALPALLELLARSDSFAEQHQAAAACTALLLSSPLALSAVDGEERSSTEETASLQRVRLLRCLSSLLLSDCVVVVDAVVDCLRGLPAEDRRRLWKEDEHRQRLTAAVRRWAEAAMPAKAVIEDERSEEETLLLRLISKFSEVEDGI